MFTTTITNEEYRRLQELKGRVLAIEGYVRRERSISEETFLSMLGLYQEEEDSGADRE